jgi:penicillin-binding protein 2
VETAEGALVEAFAPKLVRTVAMTDEQHHVLVDALKAVVSEPGGTGFRARLSDVVVAGKTGTAQVQRLGKVRIRADQMNYWERDHAWFAAFAPADDPEVTVVVLNEHSGFGGAEAAPAAAAVLKRYFELKKTDAQAFAAPMLANAGATPPGAPPPEAPAPALASSPPPAPQLAASPAVPPPPDVGPVLEDPGAPPQAPRTEEVR